MVGWGILVRMKTYLLGFFVDFWSWKIGIPFWITTEIPWEYTPKRSQNWRNIYQTQTVKYSKNSHGFHGSFDVLPIFHMFFFLAIAISANHQYPYPIDFNDGDFIRVLTRRNSGPYWGIITPRKFNIDPENRPSQKETHLPTIIFQGAMLVSGIIKGSWWLSGTVKKPLSNPLVGFLFTRWHPYRPFPSAEPWIWDFPFVEDWPPKNL